MSHARALVLDFGGVISRTLFETHPQTERALGLPPGTLTWRGPFDPASDAPWRDMQAGLISERDYWLLRTRETGALMGESWDAMQTLVRRARGAEPEHIVRPEAVRLINLARKAGIKLAVLSNELDLFYGPELRSRLECLAGFDAIIDATYTGCLKPDPRAYRMCAEALVLPVGECILIDDQARNVEGALAAGMDAVEFDVRDAHRSFGEAAVRLGLAWEAGTP
ncbi:MAG: HAD-IA family hydrolase [Burkholderiales bacterium]|nr:HAD-IA family hydrolase [Burkholderiales bacterium]